MNARRSLVLLALVVSLTSPHAVVTAAPAPPAGDEPVADMDAGALPGEVVHSWALAPAGSNTSDGAGNRSSLAYAAEPGSVIQDAVTLFNLGTEALTFRVYATDAFNNAGGEFDLLPGAEEPSGVGSWLSVAEEFITVNPSRQVTIPFTLTIPADAAPGDHVGAVVASSPTQGTGDAGDLVTLDRRTGSRLFVRVAGPLTPELAITSISTDYRGQINPMSGSATVTYTLENRGNVRLSGSSAVSVSVPGGLARSHAADEVFADLLPGGSIDFTAVIDDVAATGLLVTDISAEASGEGVGGEQVSASALTFAPPMAILLGLLALLFAWLAVRAYGRHKQSDDSDRDPEIRGHVEADELEPQAT